MKVPIILNIYQKPESGYTKNIKRRTAAKTNTEGKFMKRRFMKTVLPVCLATSMCMTGAIISSAEEGENIVLKFTYKQNASNDPLEAWLTEKNIIGQFEEQHPGVTIELSPISSTEGDYATLLALQLSSSSTAPDIFMEDTYMTATDAASGYLACLDDYLEQWDDYSNYLDGTKDAVKGVDGKSYGVPISTDSRGIWFNRDVLEKAGYGRDWQPKTWADIIEAGQKIKETQPDVAPLAMSVAASDGESVSMQTFEQILYGTGDTLYEDGKWNVGSQGLKDTFAFIDEIVNSGVMLDLDQALSADTQVANLLADGKIGMDLSVCTLSNTWLPTGSYPVENVEEKIGFAGMPTQTGDPATVTMTGGWSWAISSYCENKDMAMEFLEFCGNKENATYRSLYDGRMSPRKDSVDIEEYGSKPFINEANANMANAHVRPKNESYAMVTTQIQTIVEELVTGALSPEEAEAEYKNRVVNIVGEDNVYE